MVARAQRNPFIENCAELSGVGKRNHLRVLTAFLELESAPRACGGLS
jgi:hypothetical protein